MILEVSALSKAYRQGNKHIYAVRNAYLQVGQGDFCSIVGASGSGKTTLLQMIAGNLTPDQGKIVLDGVDLTASSAEKRAQFRRQKIGFVYQRFYLIEGLTAKENIVLPSLLDGRKPERVWFDELVNRLGIEDRLDHLPSQMSGGQMQRVAIARALINHPAILIADEPTGNLDKATAEEILNLLLDLHRMGQTIILVTHDNSLAAHADYVCQIDDGQLFVPSLQKRKGSIQSP